MLGSAQIRIEGSAGVWVAAGDYKRAADPTCAPFEPVRCDTFITESTFGLPIYRWDDTAAGHRATSSPGGTRNREAEKASVIFCYTLGKAQRLLAELARVTDRTVFVHGMMLGMIEAYREAGVDLPDGEAGDRATKTAPRQADSLRRRTGAGTAVGPRHAVDAAARDASPTRSPQG